MKKSIRPLCCLIFCLTLLTACGVTLFSCGAITDPAGAADDPPPSISVRSMQELNEMREMIRCADEEVLDQYLRGIEGGGADSREDLEFFISLIDSVPYVKLMEGDITWISYRKSDVSEMLYITLEAPSGDWMRIEYFLSVLDVQASIKECVAVQEEGITFSPPLRSNDGKINVYHQMRAAHPSGQGDMITWTVDIDSIFANIVFYDAKGDTLLPETVLPSKNVIPVN